MSGYAESPSRAQPQRCYECCILGAGPAGLAAALELGTHGVTSVVLLDRNQVPGGLSRTERFDRSRFDVGPHRFFTKVPEINRLWHDTLGPDFRPLDRLTRIYYKNKLFHYPVKAGDVAVKLGCTESLLALLSFARAQVGSRGEPRTFEDWVVQKFGRRLYEIFFKTYTEKVWGLPCREIGAEWAAQRIRGLNIFQTLRKALRPGRNGEIRSLVDRFHYPVLGAGQMYEAMCEAVVSQGAEVLFGARVTGIHREGPRVTSVTVQEADGRQLRVAAKQFFSSIPITHFFKMLAPVESPPVLRAAEALYYRDHITVNLVVDDPDLFPDQWIYVHAPDVRMARIANYNNFSQAMVGEPNKSAISVEYFSFQFEDLWGLSDEDLKELAADELSRLGLVPEGAIEKGWVVRETESYPTYYLGFQEPYQVLKARLGQFENLSPIGRGGLYRYNNQDHSALTGLLAARKYLRPRDAVSDIWDVNVDAEYHEEQKLMPNAR